MERYLVFFEFLRYGCNSKQQIVALAIAFFPFLQFWQLARVKKKSRGAQPFFVTMMHEPLRAHPKAACRHRCRRLKRSIVIIARAQQPKKR
jgi:cytochrome oxidase assembly protein ShyY1